MGSLRRRSVPRYQPGDQPLASTTDSGRYVEEHTALVLLTIVKTLPTSSGESALPSRPVNDIVPTARPAAN